MSNYFIKNFNFDSNIPFTGSMELEYIVVSLAHISMTIAVVVIMLIMVGWVLFSTTFMCSHTVTLFHLFVRRKVLGVVHFVVLTLFLILLWYWFDSLVFFLTKILVPLIINALVFLLFIASYFYIGLLSAPAQVFYTTLCFLEETLERVKNSKMHPVLFLTVTVLLFVVLLFFSTVFVNCLSDFLSSQHVVHCAYEQPIFEAPLKQIPSYTLRSLQHTEHFQKVMAASFPQEATSPLKTLVINDLLLIGVFAEHIHNISLMCRDDFLFRIAFLDAPTAASSAKMAAMMQLYAKEVVPELNFFAITSFGPEAPVSYKSYFVSPGLEHSMASFVMDNFQKGLFTFFEQSSSYLKKLRSFDDATSCTPLVWDELVGCSKKSYFDINCTSLAGWKHAVSTGLFSEMSLRSEAWDAHYLEISRLKCLVNPLNSILAEMLPEHKFIRQLETKSLSLYNELNSFLQMSDNNRLNFHSAIINHDFFKNYILPSMVERDLYIYSWLRLEFSAEGPLTNEYALICDKHPRTWLEYFYSFFTTNYGSSLKNDIVNHTSGIPEVTRNVVFDVSAPRSRSWVGFFYDILNPGYWFGTQPVPTINIDPNVTGHSSGIPVQPTRTWGSFVYDIITLRFLWS